MRGDQAEVSLIQQAIAQVMMPIFDPGFSDASPIALFFARHLSDSFLYYKT